VSHRCNRKNLKGDLAIRPIFHQDQARIEAHIFIAFLAYCLHATLARRLHALAPGLSPRSVIEKFAAMQMMMIKASLSRLSKSASASPRTSKACRAATGAPRRRAEPLDGLHPLMPIRSGHFH
jgi:hypothetical protein